MCPKCNHELFIWQRQGAPWKASCLGCGYQDTFWPDEEEFEPSLTQRPAGDTPSCCVGEDERY
jgi:Zn ribbon nucleic-acid-binding protein